MSINVSHHHNHIQFMGFDAVSTKHFPYDSFEAIPVYSARQKLLARDDPKPGMLLTIASKENLEVLIRDTFRMNYTVKTIYTQ